MSDTIPGFTPEQSWALRAVAKEAARETVAELGEKPCGFDCRDMADVKDTLYGKDGLKTTVTRHDEQLIELVWLKRAVLGEIVAIVGVAIIAFLR
jgi:hypothetical protein